MKRITRKDIALNIFYGVTIFLSVYAFGLLRQLTGEPVTKMLTDILIVFLLVVLNTAVLVLYELNKKLRK